MIFLLENLVPTNQDNDRPEPARPIRLTCAPGLRHGSRKKQKPLGSLSNPLITQELRSKDAWPTPCEQRFPYAPHTTYFSGSLMYTPRILRSYTKPQHGFHGERVVPSDGYLSVDTVMPKGSPHNSMFVNMRIKDAIVDRINRERSHRPDSGPRTDRTVIQAYWAEGKCRLSLSISGRKTL